MSMTSRHSTLIVRSHSSSDEHGQRWDTTPTLHHPCEARPLTPHPTPINWFTVEWEQREGGGVAWISARRVCAPKRTVVVVLGVAMACPHRASENQQCCYQEHQVGTPQYRRPPITPWIGGSQHAVKMGSRSELLLPPLLHNCTFSSPRWSLSTWRGA